eukprot:12508151-Alexandrium_andersonii.AAC.1
MCIRDSLWHQALNPEGSDLRVWHCDGRPNWRGCDNGLVLDIRPARVVVATCACLPCPRRAADLKHTRNIFR